MSKPKTLADFPSFDSALDHYAYVKFRLENTGEPTNAAGQVGDALMRAIAEQFPNEAEPILRQADDDVFLLRKRLRPLVDWDRVRARIKQIMELPT
jgi:hypothetical protein